MPIHGYPGNIITANPTAPTVSSASGVWTTEQQLQAIAAGNWPGYEYPISRSLRFNSADSAYLNRTPASAGNRKTWTWSGWIKKCNFTAYKPLFYADAGGNTNCQIQFLDTNVLRLFQQVGGVDTYYLVTTQVFRDPSAWYHIVVAVDTTQATASNRLKLYINGTQVGTTVQTAAGNSHWYLGGITTTQNFGYIANMTLYTTKLSQEQIQQNYYYYKGVLGV